MSYDIYLKIFTGNTEQHFMDIGNHTSNTSKMWNDAMGKPLYELDGIMAEDAIWHLERGIKNMKDSPEYFKEMNPKNGWGNYDTALKYLEDILTACKEHPKTKIEISR